VLEKSKGIQGPKYLNMDEAELEGRNPKTPEGRANASQNNLTLVAHA